MWHRAIIVGAGISGLAAARALLEAMRSAGCRCEILVLEQAGEVGGKARSIRRDGWLVEAGPASFLEEEETRPVMRRLIAAAGLEDAVLPAAPAAAHRFLVRHGRLREVHARPLRFLTSGILGPAGVLRLLREPLIAPNRTGTDESLWGFAARRIGRQAADRLIAPMALGIFAGDARRLSLTATFPRLAALERRHGSLVRAMLARRSAGAGGPSGPRGSMLSLRDGLQSLPIALARDPEIHVRCGAQVDALSPGRDGSWQVRVRGEPEPLPADCVVLAGEGWASAGLLSSVAPVAAAALSAIPYPPVAVAALGYGPRGAHRIPDGFGVLAAREEGLRILGSTWESRTFPGRSPDRQVLVRAMLGGRVDPAAAGLADGELVEIAHADLSRLLGIRERPVFQQVVSWPRAIPQYELGHAARSATVDRALQDLQGLFLAGNALRGVSFAKSAVTGWACGEEAARLVVSRTQSSRSTTSSRPTETAPARATTIASGAR